MLSSLSWIVNIFCSYKSNVFIFIYIIHHWLFLSMQASKAASSAMSGSSSSTTEVGSAASAAVLYGQHWLYSLLHCLVQCFNASTEECNFSYIASSMAIWLAAPPHKREVMPLLWLSPLLEDEYITFHFIAQCSVLILLWKKNFFL